MQKPLAVPSVVLLVAFIAVLLSSDESPTHPTPASRVTPTGTETDLAPIIAYREWQAGIPRRDTLELEPEELQTAIKLAKARKTTMLELIKHDPERALQESIGRDDYHSLPAALKPFFEKPFNAIATLGVYPVCQGEPGTRHEPARVLAIDGQSWDASVFGKRSYQMTKEETPLAGITLDGVAAIAEFSLEIADDDDANSVARLPLGNPDPDHDFATGAALGENPVIALAGGKRYLFKDTDTVGATNLKLAELDQAIGPKNGAKLVFALADGGSGDGIDWSEAEELVDLQADEWSEQPKDVMCIRVDFSDVPGEFITQAALASVMNLEVNSSISEMSYGKTSITATVSSTTLRMPLPSAIYLPNDNDALHRDAKAAYEVLHGAGSLDHYDIVVVHFPSIGMTGSGGGFAYGGLAGGSRQWLQNSSSPGLIIHEFGHNYGLGHASFWSTNDGSVAGSGANEEYGDFTDILGSGPDPEGHFHPQAKVKAGWLEADQWEDASISGIRRIYRFDDAQTSSDLRGVRVDKGANEYYWIGFRPGVDQYPEFKRGAYLMWQRPGHSRSWLLDTSPDSAKGKYDAPLPIGTTYSDTPAGVHITALGSGGSGAEQWMDVNVQLGTFPGNQAPVGSFTASATADARIGASFTSTVTDPDGDELAYSWDFGDGSLTENSASVSHAWVISGTYTITLTVSDMKGGTLVLTEDVTVDDPLDTWFDRTSGTTADLNDIALGNGTLVTVGYDAPNFDGICRLSTDGTNWVGHVIEDNFVPEGVIYNGSQFIVVGSEYDVEVPGWVGSIHTSPDGISWTNRHLMGPDLRDVAFGNGSLVAVGNAGTVLRSADGITWGPQNPGTSRTLDGIAFGDGTFVIGGFENGMPGLVLTSTDGVSWTDTSSGTGFGINQGIYYMEWCHDRFLATGWYGKLQHSTDQGVSFSTTVTSNYLTAAMAHGNGAFLAAGVNQDDGNSDVDLISVDGEIWSVASTTSVENRNAAIFFEDTFITVGNDGSIRQSAPFMEGPQNDYASWSETNFPGSPPLSGMQDDFDGDGFANLIEYATGTDPTNAGDRVSPTLEWIDGKLTMTLPKGEGVTDVSFSAEFSTDLSLWVDTGFTITENGATQFSVRIDATPGPGASTGFIRPVLTLDP